MGIEAWVASLLRQLRQLRHVGLIAGGDEDFHGATSLVNQA